MTCDGSCSRFYSPSRGLTQARLQTQYLKVALQVTQTPRVGPIADVDAKVLETSIQRGLDFLIGYQNSDGSWGNPTRTKGLNIYAPVPGAHHAFRTATTAMCIMALIESGSETPDKRNDH